MTKPQPNTLEFLLQLDVIEEVLSKIGKEQWQTLYLSASASQHRFGMWCALLDEDSAKRAIGHDGWDLYIGNGNPGFSQGWSDEQEVITYHRFGGSGGVRPLVLHRSFHRAFPQYVEMDEEFRLYHNLAEDKKRGLLLSFDASGREIEVARVTPSEVSARLKYLKQFQGGTGRYLAIYIDSVRYSQIPLTDIPADEQSRVETNNLTRWRRNVAKCHFKEGFETFSRLLSKVIIAPPPREKSGIWPFAADDDQTEVEFIIGVDENGIEIVNTSNPEKLSNYFGANPGAPSYLTPVYFRREVLGKYYAEPGRYTVSDGQLTCLSLWNCQIDNELESYVVVFLGDLGRDLPYEERLHWRQFNIPPENGISETNFRRSFLAQFTSAQSPDLGFREEYARLTADWEKKYGWPLFLPLSCGDAHLLDMIRIPVTNSQSEFDEQVLHLTKLLVDSLNEKNLATRAGELKKGRKGIDKLSAFFKATEFAEDEVVVQFLRDLQLLRSTGSGHRKGSGYEKTIAKLGIDLTRKPDAGARLLEEATAVLLTIRCHYLDDRQKDC